MSKKEERIPKSKVQLFNDFNEQISFICVACKLYDSGDTNKIKMATPALRSMFYKQRNSQLLIDLIGIDKAKFVSSVPNDMTSSDFYSGPIFIDSIIRLPQSREKFEYFPKCYITCNDFRSCTFDDWIAEPILKADGISFSRRTIIDYVANQDGGTHVDPSLKKQYVNLINGVFSFQINFAQDKVTTAESIQLALLRQIAHEAMETFILQGIKNIEYESGERSTNNQNRLDRFSYMESSFQWLD